MPVPKKKGITSEGGTSRTEPTSSPDLPSPQGLREYLRNLAQEAMRTLLEGVMREELEALLGVGWAQCSPTRKGYRNGYYPRDAGDFHR